MDEYKEWEQDLKTKPVNELEKLIQAYNDTISQLQATKRTIDDQLYMLQDQLPTVRRIYNLKMRDENAKQQEKTL
jgi:hypothetical protein